MRSRHSAHFYKCVVMAHYGLIYISLTATDAEFSFICHLNVLSLSSRLLFFSPSDSFSSPSPISLGSCYVGQAAFKFVGSECSASHIAGTPELTSYPAVTYSLDVHVVRSLNL